MDKYFINEEVRVEDSGATRSHGKGERREDYADVWRDTGNVVLVGLSGSGRMALAKALAERTGAPVVVPGNAADAAETLSGSGTIIVLNDGLVEDPSVRSRVHGSGKVFYLMADSNTLSARVAERDGVEDREALWRECSARLALMEPVFYEVLHFILQAGGTPESVVEDALEKIAY
ncbi:shikimate kinase [Pseudodesulfovibrio sp.]|uniref:shikimate kinase n=1 Tax=unclassified Pseudodesulfovibrio TaxID=2661612 RepID=UPI003B00B5D3